jgi:hypothetical protein
MKLPEGLLEVNAPLAKERKEVVSRGRSFVVPVVRKALRPFGMRND